MSLTIRHFTDLENQRKHAHCNRSATEVFGPTEAFHVCFFSVLCRATTRQDRLGVALRLTRLASNLTKRHLNNVIPDSCLLHYLNSPPTATERIANHTQYDMAAFLSITSYVEDLDSIVRPRGPATRTGDGWSNMTIDLHMQKDERQGS